MLFLDLFHTHLQLQVAGISDLGLKDGAVLEYLDLVAHTPWSTPEELVNSSEHVHEEALHIEVRFTLNPSTRAWGYYQCCCHAISGSSLARVPLWSGQNSRPGKSPRREVGQRW